MMIRWSTLIVLSLALLMLALLPPAVLGASSVDTIQSTIQPPSSPADQPPLPPSPISGTFYFDPPPADHPGPSPLRQPQSGSPLIPAPTPVRPPAPKIGTLNNVLNFTQLDVLVVVYTHTVDGLFTNAAGLQQEVDEAETFYWRNSHLRLDLAIDVLWIDEYKELDEFSEFWPNAYWLPFWDTDGDGNSVRLDLYERGINDNQYDGVVVYYAWGQGPHGSAFGGGTFGVDVGFLGQTGYTAIPLEWDLQTQDWFFIHEFHHQLDSMFYYSGYPAYPHADIPHPMPGDFGENYDFNAAILRGWPVADWAGLAPPWRQLASTPDSDGDGLPDQDSDLPLTEATLGTDPSLSDSDGDGLDDLGEAMAGILSTSDPLSADTDADAVPDGLDPYPLYPVNRLALPGSVTVDGIIGSNEGWRLLDNTPWQLVSTQPFRASFYTTWDDDYLYLGFHVSHYAYVRFYLDATNDGWFHGSDNYEIGFDPSYVHPTSQGLAVRVWDAALNTLCANTGGPWPMWDNDLAYPFSRLVQPGDIVRYARSDGGTGFTAELAIPRNTSTGLLPEPGDVIGLRVTLSNLDGVWNHSATLFETESFVDIGLVEGLNGTSDFFETAALAPFWTWVNPLGDAVYSLTDQPGSLRLFVPDGNHDLHLALNAPRLLQSVSDDFAVQTQVMVNPLHNYQGAGLLLWADANNFVRLERARGSDQQINLWYRNGGVDLLGEAVNVSATTLYLRLERSGNNFAGLYSLNGIDWLPIGTVNLQSGLTMQAGLTVINVEQNNPIYADFADFQVIPAYDTTPPTGQVVIDGGRPFTGDPWVMLNLIANDPSGNFRMQLDDGRQLWDPQSYIATWPAIIPDNEGDKSISVRFQDNFGNTSAPAIGVIGLDHTPPTATFSLGQNGMTGQVTTTVQATATDSYAGPAAMMFSNEWGWEAEAMNHDIGGWKSDPGASIGAAWIAQDWAEDPGLMVYGPLPPELPSGRSYRAIFRLKVTDNWVPCPVVTLKVVGSDGQGNEQVLANRGIAASEFPQPNVYQEFALDFDYSDPGVSELEIQVYFEDRIEVYVDQALLFGQPQPYGSTTVWPLASDVDGWHTIWGRFVDAADNVTQTQATVLLDTTPPSSMVAPLPPSQPDLDFTVSWSGSDPAPGSGLADYDVQVLERPIGGSGGQWTDWLTHTQETTALFNGRDWRTICFRSRARDAVDNLEDPPPQDTGDTCTNTPALPPEAAFGAWPLNGARPLTVNFTDVSSGTVTAWQWDFGNGLTSTLESPSHTYANAGVYTVTLTVSGPIGTDMLTRTNYITVEETHDLYLPLILRQS